jgi:hypothetical protein
MLFGLDMLKRHQCVLDLKQSVLRMGSGNVTVPFLSEGVSSATYHCHSISNHANGNCTYAFVHESFYLLVISSITSDSAACVQIKRCQRT